MSASKSAKWRPLDPHLNNFTKTDGNQVFYQFVDVFDLADT